jgi:hypothetical protein
MTPRKTAYERVGAKASRGEFTLIEPLDTMILALLPEEGTMFAGLYPLGETVRNLVKKLDGKVPSSMVSNRLRTMSAQSLCRNTKSVSAGRGSTVWQRTKAGTTLLSSKEKKNGS